MTEIWKPIKTVYTQTKIKINYLVSNKGNVKLKASFKDKEIATYNLELGKGLYCSYNGGYSIHIASCSGKLYDFIYFNFTNNKRIKWNQIHHLDYNHCNNDLDNLCYCTPSEHGNFHAWQFKLGNEEQGYIQQWEDWELKELDKFNKAQEYYKWLDDNKDLFSLDNARNYIRNLRKDIEQIAKPIIEQYRLDKEKERNEKRLLKEQEKQRVIEEKIKSGKYKVSDNGRLYRADIGDILRRGRENDPTCYQRVSNSLKEKYKSGEIVSSGRELTEETKEKIRQKLLGRTFTQEHIDNLRKAAQRRKQINLE